MITQLIEFDVKKNSHVTITAKEGDINSRKLEFRLLDNSLPFSLVGRTVRCYMVKPDKRVVFNDLNIIDAEDGRCVLTLTTQSLIKSGMANIELIVYEEGRKLSTIPIKMNIMKSLVSDEFLYSSDEFGALESALWKIDTFTETMNSKATKEELKKVNEQLDTKANLIDVFLKENGININDFDEETRKTFLEAQGIDVNYVLGRENVKPYNTNFFDGINLFNPLTVTKGYYVNYGNGELITNSSYDASDYIEIENIPYYWYGFNPTHLAFTDSNKQYIQGDYSGNNYLKNPFIPPTNAKYIRVSVPKTTSLNDVVLKSIPLTEKEKIKDEYIPSLPVEFDQLDFTVKSKNLFNKENVTIGYYVNYTNGQLMANENYVASEYIDIEGKTKITRTKATQLAFSDKNKTYISGNNSNKTLAVPSNAKYVIVSVPKTDLDIYQVEEGDIETSYQPFGERIPQILLEKDGDVTYLKNEISKIISNKKGYQEVNIASLNSGEILKINELNCIKKNKTINFNATITSLSEIKIGVGETSYNGNYIVVDSTNISVYGYGDSAWVIKQVSHGLTLSDFISVNIKVDNKTNATILVMTSNGMFETTVDNFHSCNGNVFARLTNGSLTNCKLNFSSEDYKNKIYMFGDSYFSLNSTMRWTQYLINYEYDKNVLLDGFGGRTSATALTSFNNTIKYGTPKYAIWCMGMNDPDTSTEVNTSWLSSIQSFISICNSSGITPILATIPNVPTRNHNFKNEWIRNSGYRYIDFNKAVGADKNVNWYSNMLYSDGVHPDVLGAKALFMQILIDVPEIRE